MVQSFTYIMCSILCGLDFYFNLWVPRVSHILPIWRLEYIIFFLTNLLMPGVPYFNVIINPLRTRVTYVSTLSGLDYHVFQLITLCELDYHIC